MFHRACWPIFALSLVLGLGGCLPDRCGDSESAPGSPASESESRAGGEGSPEGSGKAAFEGGTDEEQGASDERAARGNFEEVLTSGEWSRLYGLLREEYRELAEAHSSSGTARLGEQMEIVGFQMSWMEGHHPLVSGPKRLPRTGRSDHPLFGRRPMWSHWESAIAPWHRRLASRHEEWRETVGGELADRHTQMAEWHTAMAEAVEVGGEADDPGPPTQEEVVGRNVYIRACATCHSPDGSGVERAFPPLQGHPVATGPPRAAARAVLTGVEGPTDVDGEPYAGAMPGYADRLSDRQIAAVLTYVRTSWGNDAGEVSTEQVEEWRREFVGGDQ